MKDKTIIITGASDGIGRAAATNLKSSGANIVITGRSKEKTKAMVHLDGSVVPIIGQYSFRAHNSASIIRKDINGGVIIF